MKVLVMNGPNLNMLGAREPGVYGTTSLERIEEALAKKAAGLGIELEFFQSNHEGALVDKVQAAPGQGVDALILNPGGYTHTSVALRDALLAVNLPFIEVHVSRVASREQFRQVNYFSDIARGTITGLGPLVYELALEALWRLHGQEA
ncbi:MAG TPA: type II 3-dehydroquinate dehydratase [Deltaproteobacteria bacterium]|mgnify:CR=1 FL=1|nr:type II 3-dehydroquinate dehydratase [Deltaproteobacteria bacterium]HPP81416.1 type II 3-dehydroquinate dehydratase [Deltaproteobacteria bacterium]